MNKKGLTPDERFLLKLFELAILKGDAYHPIEIKRIALGIAYKETAVKNIVKLLAQANLIKKEEEGFVSLTNRGHAFVQDELDA